MCACARQRNLSTSIVSEVEAGKGSDISIYLHILYICCGVTLVSICNPLNLLRCPVLAFLDIIFKIVLVLPGE